MSMRRTRKSRTKLAGVTLAPPSPLRLRADAAPISDATSTRPSIVVMEAAMQAIAAAAKR